MKKHTASVAILCGTLFLGLGSACGSDLVEKIDKLADEACACKDRACEESLEAKLLGLTKDGKKPSEADQKKILKSMGRWKACAGKWLIREIDNFADEACACKDMACAEKVQAKLMDLIKDAKEADQEKIMKSMERMGECMAKLAMPK